MYKKAKHLKREKGILAEPEPKKGRPLKEEVIQRVKAFYESDEFSRMCPGQKEYKSVRIDGNKVQMQKRLLLVNLKELHQEYLKTYPNDKIGFSKFCELRPEWCVTVNSKGMHSVCVCEHHQNAKLLASVIPNITDYKDLLAQMVCDVTRRDCMMHSCDACPGKTALNEYLMKIFTENNVDTDDSICYKQWLHTDRTTLVDLHLPLADFLDLVCKKFDSLRQHHFITKSQAAHLKSAKENLSPDTAIVLMDFAENYSFMYKMLYRVSTGRIVRLLFIPLQCIIELKTRKSWSA